MDIIDKEQEAQKAEDLAAQAEKAAEDERHAKVFHCMCAGFPDRVSWDVS